MIAVHTHVPTREYPVKVNYQHDTGYPRDRSDTFRQYHPGFRLRSLERPDLLLDYGHREPPGLEQGDEKQDTCENPVGFKAQTESIDSTSVQ